MDGEIQSPKMASLPSPQHSDTPSERVQPQRFSSPARAAERKFTPRQEEQLLAALKRGLTEPGEHRLFAAGKVPGLFPSKSGVSGQLAAWAMQNGWIETVRTESRGRTIIEWVRVTPRGVAYIAEHDSPQALLRELRELLGFSQRGLPAWLACTSAELRRLEESLTRSTNARLARIDALLERVEETLRRIELRSPGISEAMNSLIPWADAALTYLDQRRQTRGASPCPLPELFEALRQTVPELTLRDFHDGLRRMGDLRIIQLHPPESAASPSDPEFTLIIDAALFTSVSR
jgi:DNA-binding PadR family transcriptional regulator